ncbi:radical SAM protein [Ruminococcus sp.]|uniref:radical SAM protein n=1 Tax=Ruminococcus sp. TaxID=41978 RepID=UPI00258B2DA2|nr:radical SAM protein [Ruminococcus sp.]MCR5020534.1 radical SAM protein [Ruminococcus sp.]
MEQTIYRSSMFNMLVKDGQCSYIYNSYQGLNGVRRIELSDTEQVESLLDQKEIKRDGSELVERLIEKKYLVPADHDEKADRDRLYYEYTMDTTLDLMIHTTESCNFRCRYCALDFKSNMLEEDVQDRIINYIRKNVRRHTALSIDWFGGEPLVGMSAIERMSEKIIAICREAHIPYRANVTTNGFLLTPENVQKLLAAHVVSITVTIDGLKETHDDQRIAADGSPTWDRLIGNLEWIRDNVKNRHFFVNIRANFTKKMFEELPEFYSLLNEKFGSDGRFSFFARPVGDWGGERVKGIYDRLVEGSQMSLVYQYLAENQKQLVCRVNQAQLEPLGSQCRSSKKNRYVITVSGKVQKCETVSPKHEIGYLDESGNMILDWHNENMWIFGYRKKNNSKCDECPISCVCMRGTCPKNGVLYPNFVQCGYAAECADIVKLVGRTNDIETL